MLRRSMNEYIPDYDVKTHYKMTDLHMAALRGDVTTVRIILDEHPEQYPLLTAPYHSDDGIINADEQLFSSTTAIHFALLYSHYDIAKLLLEHDNCKDVINIPGDACTAILHMIATLPDKKKAIELSELALKAGADINYQSGFGRMTALYEACANKNKKLLNLLLNNKANSNLYSGFPRYLTPLHMLALELSEIKNPVTIKTINEMILLLLAHDANPKVSDDQGKSFFDYVSENPIIKKNLSKDIRVTLRPSWEETELENMRKSKKVFWKAHPLMETTKQEDNRNPSLEDIALLVELKKERRQKIQSDYDCTVLANKEQFEAFLYFAKMRFSAAKQAFQTQFILQSKINDSDQVAIGQLNFDSDGKVSIFLVEILGHRALTHGKRSNQEISELIRQSLPDALLYTVDKCIRSTKKGCHHFALYISEQLSAAAHKNKDLCGDLNAIYQKLKINQDGFHIIPWELCPTYTGIPRIIHATHESVQRIRQNLAADQQPVNKAEETYLQSMSKFFVQGESKMYNSTYDVKRHKFSMYLKEALEHFDHGVIVQKQFAAFTDLINRIPVDVLAAELNVKLEQQGDGMGWKITIPSQCLSKHVPVLKGSIEELNEQLKSANEKLMKDETAFRQANLLYQYAAIKAAAFLVLGLMLKKNIEAASSSSSMM